MRCETAEPGTCGIFPGFGRVYGHEGAFEKAVKAFDEAILLDGGKRNIFATWHSFIRRRVSTDKGLRNGRRRKNSRRIG
jgi:hypothetical protein